MKMKIKKILLTVGIVIGIVAVGVFLWYLTTYIIRVRKLLVYLPQHTNTQRVKLPVPFYNSQYGVRANVPQDAIISTKTTNGIAGSRILMARDKPKHFDYMIGLDVAEGVTTGGVNRAMFELSKNPWYQVVAIFLPYTLITQRQTFLAGEAYVMVDGLDPISGKMVTKNIQILHNNILLTLDCTFINQSSADKYVSTCDAIADSLRFSAPTQK